MRALPHMVLKKDIIKIKHYGHIQKLCVHNYSEYIDREPEEDRYVEYLVQCCLRCSKYVRRYATDHDKARLAERLFEED